MLVFLYSFASRNVKKKKPNQHTHKNTTHRGLSYFFCLKFGLPFGVILQIAYYSMVKSQHSFKIQGKQFKAKCVFFFPLKTSGVLAGKIIYLLQWQSGWINLQINVKYNRNWISPFFLLCSCLRAAKQKHSRKKTEAKCACTSREADEYCNTRPGLGACY